MLSYSLPIQGGKGGVGGGLRRQGWGALSPLFSMHKETNGRSRAPSRT